MSAPSVPIVVLGAGPAGLGAALRLARRQEFTVTVLERGAAVGGNAGSFELDGVPVDFGSHRLHPTCSAAVLADVRELLGADLLDRPRHGRIRLRERWLHFPLKPLDLALRLPPDFTLGVLRDGVWKSAGTGDETFATVLERGLGRTICRDFYFPYALKIWGLPAEELDAEQARRRVSASSLGKLMRKVLGAVPGLKPKTAGRFFYPRGGFGQISDAYHRAAVTAGATVKLETEVAAVECDGRRAVAVCGRNGTGEFRLPASQVLSTVPLPALVRLVRPAAPSDVLTAAAALRYRGMILIYLVLETDRFTEFDAHYFPETEIPITRLSEPKNYGLAAAPGTTVLCAELPCGPDEPAWGASDAELQALLLAALEKAGLPVRVPVRRVVVRRLPHAYPVYTRDYREHFARLDAWATGIDGLVTLGRQGLFVHDNTHHTLAMAYAASDCITPDGTLNRARWREHRWRFESHVVED